MPGTWAFKIKRFPDGLVRKLKSRWCCRGDRQVKDVDFFDTYAPVVKWTTVRLLLILTAQLGLATKQVDCTAAFVHADVDKPGRTEPMWQVVMDLTFLWCKQAMLHCDLVLIFNLSVPIKAQCKCEVTRRRG